MSNLLKSILRKFGYSITALTDIAKYPNGHMYSPVPSLEEIKKREQQIFEIEQKEIPGIDLNENAQLTLLDELSKYYSKLPFKDEKQNGLRFYFNNGSYLHSDAICLYGMIRRFSPEKIVEIGSGFSSAAMLDVNEMFMNNKLSLYFIDPHPERLFFVMKKEDIISHNVLIKPIQDVKLDLFRSLKENDILFIDSTHTVKTGGDVNHILFNILPILKKGVLVHFHDIFYPFEYPKKWVLENWAWNEAYAVRAFLQYNQCFKIVLFNTFLERYHEDWFRKYMPLCLRQKGGSIWLKRL